MPYPILVNFDQGGSPTSVYAHCTWEKSEKLGQRPIQISPGKNTCIEARWRFAIGCRGWAGHSELAAAACTEARQGIRNWARDSACIRNWGRLRCLRPYYRISVLLTDLLWSPYVIGQTIIFSSCFFFFLLSSSSFFFFLA